MRAGGIAALLVLAATLQGVAGERPRREGQGMEQSDRDIPEPRAVRSGGIRYEVVDNARMRGFGQAGGVVAAIDVASRRELWTVKVYDVAFEDDEETDAQEVFITRLRLDSGRLEVTNERGEVYLVDLSDRSVVPQDRSPQQRRKR